MRDIRTGDRVRVKQTHDGITATYEGVVRELAGNCLGIGGHSILALTCDATIEILSREEPIAADQIRPGMLVRLKGGEPVRCTSEHWEDGRTLLTFKTKAGDTFQRTPFVCTPATRIVENLNG